MSARSVICQFKIFIGVKAQYSDRAGNAMWIGDSMWSRISVDTGMYLT